MWPSPDTLITRRQLAQLYGVTGRGKGPSKTTNLKRGDFSPALYRCGEARTWLEDAVAAQDEAAAVFAPVLPADPVVDDRETRKAKAPLARVQQLESPRIENEPSVPVQSVGSGWCALSTGDEPFASNVAPRSRPGRYWGS